MFVETRTGDVNLYGFGWGYDDDGDDRMQFNCASVDMKYRQCQLPVHGRAVLVKRLSDARCVEGRSWGQRGDRVWVANGCRARFEVTRTGRGGGPGPAQAEQACRSEVQRRGGRILRQDAAVAMPGGYHMQLRVRMPNGATRSMGCSYASQSRQVRLEVLSGT